MDYYHQGQPQGQPQGQGYYSGPLQGSNSGLPPGWIQEWDAPDNRWFYINQNTGERTFNRPSASSDPSHNLPPGWVAEWDAPDRRWFFVNQRTGERSWDPPRGPPPAQYTQSQMSGGQMGSTYPQTEVIAQAPQKKDHSLAYGAGGAVAGLAAGALLMHEGHNVEEHWERDKEKFERDFEGRRDYRDDESREYSGGGTINQNQTFTNDERYGGDQYYKETTVVRDDGYHDGGYRGDEYRNDSLVDDAARWTGNKASPCTRKSQAHSDEYVQAQEVEDIPEDAARWTGNKVQEVEDIPEDAARWTGEKVQEVEDIPEDTARWTGEKVQEVEDIPEDVAGWVGDKVEGVEDFGDNVDDAYDEGRDDRERYDDDRY